MNGVPLAPPSPGDDPRVPLLRHRRPGDAQAGAAAQRRAALHRGALIRGERGTAKSTAVRALATLLPFVPVVSGCPYRCAPESRPAPAPGAPGETPPESSG